MSKKQIKEMNKESAELEQSIIDSRADSAVIKEFTHALDKFSEDADNKKPSDHRSYVYALCEEVGNSLVPFYIGEGKGVRVWSHEFETDKQIKLLEKELIEENRLEELEERKQELSEKINKIDEIKKRNGKIVKYIIKWGMTSREAFMAESALINLLQINGLKFDCKEKLTNKVKGHQSEGEKQTGLTKARTVEEFCEEFAKEPLYYEVLLEKKTKALLININAGYPDCLKYDNKEERKRAIKDTVCGNWSLNIERCERLGIEYVFATVQARIVGIYKIKAVNGSKFHYIFESVDEGSEYPHGTDAVPFRNGDYEFAEKAVTVAKSMKKDPSELVLDDMPYDFRKEFIEKVIKDDSKKNPANVFANSLARKYMILEEVSEDDPNYDLFSDYLYRRIIHTEEWVKKTKAEKRKKRDKAIKMGETDNLPNPDKVTDNIYGSSNPIRYIDENG